MENSEKFMKLGEQAENAGKFIDAINYYHQAAAVGNTDGMASIGLLYQYGTGVEQSYDTALDWYRKVVEAGDMDGWWLQGNVYQEMEDYAVAAACYEKAAKGNGNCKYPAIFELSKLYYRGDGREQNYERAVQLLNQAADHGVEEAIRVREAWW